MSFDGPVTTLRVRVVNGAVNVVGSPDPTTHLDISELSGRPLTVRREGSTLTVEYEEFSWQGLRRLIERGKLPDPRTLDHRAVVSVAVPDSARLEVRAVGADTVVSSLAGPADVKAVSGETTLVGLSGAVRADTVTGRVEAQSVTGPLTVASVSGDLTVVDGTSPSLRADSVNGDMIVDIDQADSPPTSSCPASPARSPSASRTRRTPASRPTPPAAPSPTPSRTCGSPASSA